MTKIKNLNLYTSAFISWIVPLFISFFLINPTTKEYLPNFWSFKVIMLVVLGSLTYFLYKRLNSKDSGKVQIASTFIIVNSVLDLIVLVGFFGISILTWATTIWPIYVIVFIGLAQYIFGSKSK